MAARRRRTAGRAAVVHFVKANEVHTGDAFSNAAFPFVDISSGGTVQGIISAVDAVRDGVQREARAGRTIDQILALKLAAPYDAQWPAGQERFVRAVYEESTRP